MNKFCSNCGKNLTSGAFCSACGIPIEKDRHGNQNPVQGGITLCADGVYRWGYELKLLKNPTILFVIFKIFGWIIFGLWLFITLLSINDNNFWWDGFLDGLKGFGIVTAIMFL